MPGVDRVHLVFSNHLVGPQCGTGGSAARRGGRAACDGQPARPRPHSCVHRPARTRPNSTKPLHYPPLTPQGRRLLRRHAAGNRHGHRGRRRIFSDPPAGRPGHGGRPAGSRGGGELCLYDPRASAFGFRCWRVGEGRTPPGRPRARFPAPLPTFHPSHLRPTQSWLIAMYLDCPEDLGVACPAAADVAALRAGIQAGDVHYHAFPLNSQLEAATGPTLAAGVRLTHALDAALGEAWRGGAGWASAAQPPCPCPPPSPSPRRQPRALCRPAPQADLVPERRPLLHPRSPAPPGRRRRARAERGGQCGRAPAGHAPQRPVLVVPPPHWRPPAGLGAPWRLLGEPRGRPGRVRHRQPHGAGRRGCARAVRGVAWRQRGATQRGRGGELGWGGGVGRVAGGGAARLDRGRPAGRPETARPSPPLPQSPHPRP